MSDYTELLARLDPPPGEICKIPSCRRCASAAAIRELQGEIERLRSGGCARDQGLTQWCAEAEALRRERDELQGDLAETRIALATAECRERVAKSERDELLKDANRYRWLREHTDVAWPGVTGPIGLDAAIDAALAKKEGACS